MFTEENLTSKNAKLKASMKSSTGFRSSIEAEISVLQWAAILVIIEDKDEGKMLIDTIRERLLK